MALRPALSQRFALIGGSSEFLKKHPNAALDIEASSPLVASSKALISLRLLLYTMILILKILSRNIFKYF
ncbi:MAG: hypothetical protein HZC16_02610 [Candidatus Omnitrophica bacterium]|nr:hypothetical protein [Candidatus Omnitrophota bacterium]